MSLAFFKYEATGNDFIIIDNRLRQQNKPLQLEATQIQRLCDRHKGIGADGLILLENHPQLDFTMRYYNADASTGLCGNGGRCSAHIAARLFQKNAFQFQANQIVLDATVQNNLVALSWQSTSRVEPMEDGYFINESASHFVQFVSQMPKEITEIGRRLRYDKRFPNGANINFVQIQNSDLVARTYERGVEAETMASGTGAVAIVRAAYFANKISRPHASVHYTGGTVDVQLSPPYESPRVTVHGTVQLVYCGHINIDFN